MKKAFTLIELLVVIAIIGILSTIAVYGYVGAQRSARDTVRKTDLNSIRQALEMYYQDNSSYPNSDRAGIKTISDSGAGRLYTALVSGFIGTIPCDPTVKASSVPNECGANNVNKLFSGGVYYGYVYVNLGEISPVNCPANKYILLTNLENGSGNLGSLLDTNISNVACKTAIRNALSTGGYAFPTANYLLGNL